MFQKCFPPRLVRAPIPPRNQMKMEEMGIY